jgi:hypothetical protein
MGGPEEEGGDLDVGGGTLSLELTLGTGTLDSVVGTLVIEGSSEFRDGEPLCVGDWDGMSSPVMLILILLGAAGGRTRLLPERNVKRLRHFTILKVFHFRRFIC